MKIRYEAEVNASFHKEEGPRHTYPLFPDLDDWFIGGEHVWEGSYEDQV